MKKSLYLFALLLIVSGLSAQQSTMSLTGVVQTPKGEPLKKVVIAVLNNTQSTKTNKNGEFVLKRVQADDQIEVIIEKKRVAVFPLNGNQRVRIDVLDSRIRVLTEEGRDEMYVLNAVPQKAQRRAGVITAEMIAKSSVTSLTEVIRQFMPNVPFIDGAPCFRGASSFYASNAALVVVDGVEMEYSSAEGAINVHDIATVEANKSGAGYGVRGANGVIIITTKH
ncbi:TonB-dependent receptor plug domain-containing protein [Parabacteroides sp. PF5-6]|uniref:TonB-dependent receptor plug domain-containing protein n=1 Tax=Parabacteroides sp. PF5-6 TaxID=1742403 RepID=UPI002404C4EF|nr:TonB-dependent receptor plug domain-containing protein [Parabacteroides sp. PF5-6]MDF9829304.1 hypothetical protein [Parabacteroides sp. PF5-6]